MSLDTDGALLALANLLAHFQYLTTAEVLLILDSQTIINLCGASLHVTYAAVHVCVRGGGGGGPPRLLYSTELLVCNND